MIKKLSPFRCSKKLKEAIDRLHVQLFRIDLKFALTSNKESYLNSLRRLKRKAIRLQRIQNRKNPFTGLRK